MALEKEIDAFRRQLPRLVLESQGKFALVHGEEIVGVFDTYADAVNTGYQKFKLDAFMVKQIAAIEKAHTFTRDIAACHK